MTTTRWKLFKSKSRKKKKSKKRLASTMLVASTTLYYVFLRYIENTIIVAIIHISSKFHLPHQIYSIPSDARLRRSSLCVQFHHHHMLVGGEKFMFWYELLGG